MTIKAALLSAPAASGMGVYLRIDELADAAQLTDRHVPTVSECDRPPGKYRWIPEPGNPYGGALWPISYLDRLAQDQIDIAAAEARRAARQLIIVERRSRQT